MDRTQFTTADLERIKTGLIGQLELLDYRREEERDRGEYASPELIEQATKQLMRYKSTLERVEAQLATR